MSQDKNTNIDICENYSDDEIAVTEVKTVPKPKPKAKKTTNTIKRKAPVSKTESENGLTDTSSVEENTNTKKYNGHETIMVLTDSKFDGAMQNSAPKECDEKKKPKKSTTNKLKPINESNVKPIKTSTFVNENDEQTKANENNEQTKTLPTKYDEVLEDARILQKKVDVSDSNEIVVYESTTLIEMILKTQEEYYLECAKYVKQQVINSENIKKLEENDDDDDGSDKKGIEPVLPRIKYADCIKYMKRCIMKIKNTQQYIVRTGHDNNFSTVSVWTIYETENEFYKSIFTVISNYSKTVHNHFMKYVDEYTITFDPSINTTLDRKNKIINCYTPPKFLHMIDNKKDDDIENHEFVKMFKKLTLLLANNDIEKQDIIIKFCAMIMQGKKNEIALTISCEQGAGKSTISKILDNLLGHNMTTVTTTDSLFKFNSLLKDRMFCYIDETSTENMAQQKVAGENLKSMISEEYFGYEAKGKDKVISKVYSSWIITSNNTIYFSYNGGRRYLDLNPSLEMKINACDSDETVKDKYTFWQRLNGTVKGNNKHVQTFNDDMTALTKYLVNIDVSNFDGECAVKKVMGKDTFRNSQNIKTVHEYLLKKYVLQNKSITEIISTVFAQNYIEWKQENNITSGANKPKDVYSDAMEVAGFKRLDKKTANKIYFGFDADEAGKYFIKNGVIDNDYKNNFVTIDDEDDSANIRKDTEYKKLEVDRLAKEKKQKANCISGVIAKNKVLAEKLRMETLLKKHYPDVYDNLCNALEKARNRDGSFIDIM